MITYPTSISSFPLSKEFHFTQISTAFAGLDGDVDQSATWLMVFPITEFSPGWMQSEKIKSLKDAP